MQRVDSVDAAIGAAEAVVVASPNVSHAEQALAALSADRHVLIEKPLAVDVSDAERVVRAAHERHAICGLAMNLRFHPAILGLRELIESGALGELRFARASFGFDLRRWRPEMDYRESYSARAELGGGIVLDAIHELDYLLWLLGTVSSVTAELDRVSDLELDVEDTALLILRFESGVLGTVDLNYVDPVYRRTCLLVGSDGVAEWDWSAGTITVSGAQDRTLEVEKSFAKTYTAVLADFLHAAFAGGTPRAVVGEGLAALRVAHAAKRSSALGQRVAL